MNHDYYEHYQLWLVVNKLADNQDNWYRFIAEECDDKEGM